MHPAKIAGGRNPIASESRPVRPVRGIDDWPLPALIEIDQASPGFLGRVMATGDLRRQAVFAAIAQDPLDDPTGFFDRLGPHRVLQNMTGKAPLSRVAAVLAGARARDIVTAAFGANPRHLLGLLRRIGSKPLPPAAYARLYALSTQPTDRARMRYLMDRTKITLSDIERAEYLRPDVLVSKIAHDVRGDADIARTNLLIDLAVQACSTVSPTSLAQSLSDVSAKTSVNDWLHGLLSRFDTLLIEPPYLGDHEAILLSTGAAVLDAGRRYRNCLKTMVLDTLAGRSYFYEFPADKVIAHVRMLSDETGFVEGIHALRNGPVDRDVSVRVRDKLAHVGLPSLYKCQDREDLKAIASLHTPWRFDDLDDAGGEEDEA